MEWFLKDYLGLKINNCHTSDDRNAGANQHRVSFSDKSSFQAALHLSKASNAEYPYIEGRRFPDVDIVQRRECYTESRGHMILTSDSVVDLKYQNGSGGDIGIVASSVLPTLSAS